MVPRTRRVCDYLKKRSAEAITEALGLVVVGGAGLSLPVRGELCSADCDWQAQSCPTGPPREQP